ncbi:flagellar basal body-associated FliL family protein [Reinekea forsetii]|nr:flagellar basal body-associated FliL family protein [Reinekea forsetii]
MADEEPIEEVEEEGEKKGGGLKKIIMIVVGFLLVSGLSAGGMWFFLKDKLAEPEAAAIDEIPMEEPITTPENGEAIYHALQPAFIINFNTNGKSRFLQTELTVLTRDPESIEVMILHNPLIRNNMLDVFTLHNFDELMTAEGKMALAEDLTKTIQDILVKEMGRPGIESILFRSFVMQ